MGRGIRGYKVGGNGKGEGGKEDGQVGISSELCRIAGCLEIVSERTSLLTWNCRLLISYRDAKTVPGSSLRRPWPLGLEWRRNAFQQRSLRFQLAFKAIAARRVPVDDVQILHLLDSDGTTAVDSSAAMATQKTEREVIVTGSLAKWSRSARVPGESLATSQWARLTKSQTRPPLRQCSLHPWI